MADTPVFQGHHLIEQNAFEQSQLLKSLARSGHFTLHGSDNILTCPRTPRWQPGWVSRRTRAAR